MLNKNEENKNISFVKTINNDTKISKLNKRAISKADMSILNKQSSILNLTNKHNESLDISLKNISSITKKEEFMINNDIHNSLFPTEANELKLQDMSSKNNDIILSETSYRYEKELSDQLINKILNANSGDEILLPGVPIVLNVLKITKPIKIIGQIGSELIITEGPIIINISNNNDNEVVKFSQVKIIFKTKENSDNPNDTKFLFKLYAGSLVEIEMCEILCDKSNYKKICFQVNSKYKNFNNESETISPIISILTIISTTISKFYQAIRAGENSIINLEKSYINNNYGKAIVILNPLITKIIETVFEKNIDNAIHIKFLKDENLYKESRKIYIQDNEIIYNHGNGIYIDGIDNYAFDLDIVISNNVIKRNKLDGLFLCELFINSLSIFDNKFHENKNNGMNITKVFNKEMKTNNTFNIIRNNEFHDSDMFGILLNDCRANIFNNSFMRNKQSGLILCVLNSFDIYYTDSYKQRTNTNSNNTLNNEINFHYNDVTTLKQNNFIKNGCSGLKIVNYNYFVNINDCKFTENIDYGLCIEYESNHIDKEKIKNFKNSDCNKMPKETYVYIDNSTMSSNLKSGINLSNGFIYLENTIISDNIDYAIHTQKEEFRHCFKYNKNKKITIIGSVGGSWGEVSISDKTFCTSCTSTVKRKIDKKSSETDNGENQNISKGGKSTSIESKKDNDEKSKCFIM